MGSYCEYLPICDDYEIILRTSITTNIAKIHKLGYIQYMNNSNNNFSLIRNGEINRIGPNYISPIYFNILTINDKMREKDAYEDTNYISNHSKIWERDPSTYQHKYCNIIINNDYDKQFCIIGFDSLLANIDRIMELYDNPRNDFIILENKCTLEYLQERIERYNFQRMKCYTLIDTPNDKLINYFKLLYLSVSDYEIININIQRPIYNTSLFKRSQIINQLTNIDNKYLEIGVEYGECFNEVHFKYKVGVDPDPKFVPINGELIKLTSDEYFLKYNETNNFELFDAIFIDGMHQVEYFIKDISNASTVLSSNGVIFVDDILPLNYNEQLKIPIRHYYENGILKYGENWTGDVWKVIYHILKNHKEYIEIFKYYYNINFRGIGMFKLKQGFKIEYPDVDIINNYSYFQDFTDYLNLLQNANEY
jgi:hypothetical protein